MAVEAPARVCPYCGGSMEGKRSIALYCTSGCSRAAWYRRNSETVIARSIERKRRLAAEVRVEKEYELALLAGEGVKQCRACALLVAVDDFYAVKSSADGLYSYCKRCTRAKVTAHHRANRQQINDLATGRRHAIRDHIREAKKGPCVDCDATYPPQAMHFHHRDPDAKIASLAQMGSQSFSIKRVDAEIAKCDLLCAICHAMRHAQLAEAV